MDGCSTWVQYMDAVHGRSTWTQYIWTRYMDALDAVHGRSAWMRCMDAVHGCITWTQNIWMRYMDAYIWMQCMDAVHGCGAWAHWEKGTTFPGKTIFSHPTASVDFHTCGDGLHRIKRHSGRASQRIFEYTVLPASAPAAVPTSGSGG